MGHWCRYQLNWVWLTYVHRHKGVFLKQVTCYDNDCIMISGGIKILQSYKFVEWRLLDCLFTSPKPIDTAGPNIWLSNPEAKSESLRLTKARGSCRKFGWKSPGVVGGADLIMLDGFQRWGCTSPNRIHQNPQWAVKCHTLLPWSSMLMSHALAELEERKAPCFSVEFLRVASSFLGVLCVVCPFSKWACLNRKRIEGWGSKRGQLKWINMD